MDISAKFNPFTLPHDRGMEPYFAELDNFKALGFSVVDCVFSDGDVPGSPLLREDWRDWAEQLAEGSRKRGIRHLQCHAPYYNFTPVAGGKRPATEMLIRRSIEAAGILGAKWIVMHPATDYSTGDMERSFQANLRYYAPYVELGERHGVGIAIENMADLFAKKDFPGTGCDRCYGALPEELCALADALASPYAGICWDFGHANLMAHDQPACLRAMGSRVKATHVHDNFGMWDEHLAPFFGTVAWGPAMAALGEIGYDGALYLELNRVPLWLPMEVRNAQWQYGFAAGKQLLAMAGKGKR